MACKSRLSGFDAVVELMIAGGGLALLDQGAQMFETGHVLDRVAVQCGDAARHRCRKAGVMGGPARRGFGKNNFLGEGLGENFKSVVFKDISARREKSHEILGEGREKRK